MVDERNVDTMKRVKKQKLLEMRFCEGRVWVSEVEEHFPVRGDCEGFAENGMGAVGELVCGWIKESVER